MKLFASVLLIATFGLANEDAASTKRVGKYTVTVRLPQSGLAAGEEVQIEFRIADATQVDPVMGPVAIVRAKVETQIDMPEMPSMPKLVETAHPEGVPGDYGIHPAFPHGGAYLLKMKVSPPAGEDFSVEFPLTVQDAVAGMRRPLVPPRFRLEIVSQPKTPRAGEAAVLRLLVRERSNPDEVYNDFEIVHEKRMHLIVVSKDLAYFRHEHPELSTDGSFILTHTFLEGGEYHLFADVAPRGAGAQVLFAKLKVNGRAGRRQAKGGSLSLKAAVGGTVVELVAPESEIETNKTGVLPAVFRDGASGAPVHDLEDYLGAKAHLILIHEDAITFVHSHPDEREIPPAGTVPFLVRLPKPGIYRAWLQFIRAGTLHTAEFELRAGRQ